MSTLIWTSAQSCTNAASSRSCMPYSNTLIVSSRVPREVQPFIEAFPCFLSVQLCPAVRAAQRKNLQAIPFQTMLLHLPLILAYRLDKKLGLCRPALIPRAYVCNSSRTPLPYLAAILEQNLSSFGEAFLHLARSVQRYSLWWRCHSFLPEWLSAQTL